MIKIRGEDRHGAGHYLAPRGGRKHNGIDIICHKNESVICFESGKITKIGFPYKQDNAKKRHLRYCEVTVGSGLKHRYFYVESIFLVGTLVERGDTIAWCQGLEEIYTGITQHYHWEIKKPDGSFIDPQEYLKGIGYEFS